MKKRKIIIVSLVVMVALAVTATIFFLIAPDSLLKKLIPEKELSGEFIPNQDIDVKSCKAFYQKDSIYSNFRKNFRFHYQTIGLATSSDSSRVILISEPPPYFNADTIQQICAQFTHLVEAKNHKIGYDGRITDLVIVLANATAQNVNRLVANLSNAIYLSDYKANTLLLPVQKPRSYFVDDNIDYQITLFEFNDWFIEKDELFVQLPDTTHGYTVENLFHDKKTGVFFSKIPGFVAWAITKNKDLSEQLSYIRQFTLDADLILGALSDSATLVIIGREREAALTELPPLNVESILLLASITEKELSQSLDVNDFLAGKMKSGNDWCPTYLSKELENTEFGHLLTITDVLLKDWSENGTIQEKYYRYPSPPSFPFSSPLFKMLGLSELVYNWNTQNAMYAIDMEGFTIYTLNRTGSLPVSYFNSPERSVSVGRRYENQAYNYFATLGNTDLARVVQYTALYQLFMDNGISYSGNIHSAFPANKPYLLLTPTRNLLNIFKSFKDSEITYIADSVSTKNYHSFQNKMINKQLKANEGRYHFKYSDVQKEEIHRNVLADSKKKLKTDFFEIRRMLNALSSEEFEQLAKYLSYPRGMRAMNQATYQTMLRARKINMLMRTLGKNNLSLINLDLNDVKNYYVNHLANSSARYLKTPSVIITYNDLLTTGGHNISSGITRVNSLTGYKRSNSSGGSYAPKPSTQKSNTASPSKKSTGTSTPAQKKSVTSPANIRPRSQVISNSPRSQRGY
ncbi:MAG: hypothetical protein PHQ33_01050 [Bacteroidales bacterium]|nr:hypothetical protein [Bacteroidales bacterium]MDD4394464.1 hypothetical protein [Bacteroidales bacterium]